MNRDFALRSNPKYHNPAFANIWDAVYMNPNYTSRHAFVSPSTQSTHSFHMGEPILKDCPRQEVEHPLFKQEPQTNPAWRQKWNLKAQTPSIYFDQSAYYSYTSNSVQ